MKKPCTHMTQLSSKIYVFLHPEDACPCCLFYRYILSALAFGAMLFYLFGVFFIFILMVAVIGLLIYDINAKDDPPDEPSQQ